MTLALDMKRALSKNSNTKAVNEPQQYVYRDTNDMKARHILGLDIAHLRPARKNSGSSTSTNKLRSVTFSDATTAAATTTDLSQSEKETSSALSRRSSSAYLKRNKKSGAQTETVKPKASSSSLRSFYDKNRAPLSVSQQTSESSSRDFALRKGAPSIISNSTQETEHSRQLRLISAPQRGASHEKNQSAPSITKYSDSSSKSAAPSLMETTSDVAESLSTQPSASRISIHRSAASENTEILTSLSKSPHPFPITKPVVDPARAKINVRRPKAGTKNWFDSLDTDSSEDETPSREPQLAENFTIRVTAASPKARIDKIPARNLPHNFGMFRVEGTENAMAEQYGTRQQPDCLDHVMHKSPHRNVNRKRKISAFENVDLMHQSVLHLESSDEDEDEDENEAVLDSSADSTHESFRSSVMSGPWDHARIDVGRAHPVSTGNPEKVLQKLQKDRLAKPQPLRLAGKRMITYLDDCSTETVTQQEDLLTSFPQTPTDTYSRGTSLLESILSEEDESSTSTKLMTVTRQEENLIAAMRLKKTAMKRASIISSKQGATDAVERDNVSVSSRSTKHGRTGSFDGKSETKTKSPSTWRHVQSSTALSPPRHSRRTDSVTTFQTESIQQPSIRSSVATYLSEGSEDLQLPHSLANEPSTSSSRLLQPPSMRSEEPQRNRDTFLSEISTSTFDASISEWSSSIRDSHVVELDPLDRQMLREGIPSQLFMERPFLGWEAQASMQQAH